MTRDELIKYIRENAYHYANSIFGEHKTADLTGFRQIINEEKKREGINVRQPRLSDLFSRKLKLLITIFWIVGLSGQFLLHAQLAVDTSQIVLVNKATMTGVYNGYIMEYYINKAYTCARSNYHTFVIIYRDTIPSSSSHPLYLRIHGGGIGYFKSDSIWSGTVWDRYIDGEPADSLLLYSELSAPAGLASMLLNDPRAFRVLVPSMCDNDLYSGIGDMDSLNPYTPDENGGPRHVDGLQSLRSALLFTQGRFNTTHIFAHGTSAGSAGAMTLNTSLGLEGKCLSGIIMDSGVMSRGYGDLFVNGCAGNIDVHSAFDRIGVYTERQGNLLPHHALYNHYALTPIYNIWNRGDRTFCGQDTVTVTLDNGQTTTGQAYPLLQQLFDQAIDSVNPGGNSVWKRVCAGVNCSKHSPTKVDAGSIGGDQDNGGADYNLPIYQWISGIINAPAAGCLAVSANEPSVQYSMEISIYPTLSSGKFWLSIPSGQITSYQLPITDLVICNVMGEKVYISALTPFSSGRGDGGEVINLSSQPNGIYFVHIQTKERSFMQKLIISR